MKSLGQIMFILHCFDAVVWMTGRAFGL